MPSIARPLRLGSWAPLPALAAALLAAVWACRDVGKERPADRLAGWGLPEMLAHLRGAGLGLRVVPTARGGGLERGAFLTVGERDWEELNLLAKVPEEAGRWRGVLYVEHGRPGETWEVRAEAWGDCCAVAGPFIFFGDPELLSRVRDVLGPDAAGPAPG